MLTRVALALVVLLTFASSAAAQDEARFGYWFDANGDPAVDTEASYFVQWRRCPPDGSACVPIPDTPSVVRGYQAAYPGETPPGTVFEAVHVRDGVETVTRTRPWHGRVTLMEPPVITGDAVVGGTVVPRGARWEGGWTAFKGFTTGGLLLACPTPTGGTGCWAVEPKLDARWAGRYLLFHQHYRGNPSGLMEVLGWQVPPFEVRQAVDTRAASRFYVFSAPVQIPPLPSARPVPPVVTVAPPTIALRSRAQRTKGQIHVGRITCAEPCHVALRVSGGNRKPTVTRFTAVGARALKAPARRGNLRVRVYVHGEQIASARVTAR